MASEIPAETISALDQIPPQDPDVDDRGLQVVCFHSRDLEDQVTSVVERAEALVGARADLLAIGLVDFDHLAREPSDNDPRLNLFSDTAIRRIPPRLLELVVSDARRSTLEAESTGAEGGIDPTGSSLDGGERLHPPDPSGLTSPSSEVDIAPVADDAGARADTPRLVGDSLESMATNMEENNRSAFRAHIESAISASEPFAVYILRFQRLSRLRDQFGPSALRELRREVQSRLLESLRTSDLVSHLDTSTIGVLCPNLQTEANVELIGERLSEAVSEPYTVRDEIVMLRPAVGFAANPDDEGSAEQLIQKATQASEFARVPDHESSDRTWSASPESASTLQLAEQIKRGLDRDQFDLQFQPIVSMETGGLVGFEGLCRWFHPEAGAISPGRFIPVAEKAGLIFELDQWVVQRGVEQLASWADRLEGSPFLTLNISRSSISQATFGTWLSDRVDSTLQDPHRLILELTESAVLDRRDVAAQNVEAIQALGVRIALDDFGAGYSSFAALKNLPIDVLKLDRSFIAELSDARDKLPPIVEAIAQTAETLGLDLVAEGIETPKEFQFVRDIGA
ncbi:MAG: putative bifunctional diguanylate cyclase/phosphodiesterase, partial [Bradymonadaceae bacterium]